MVGQYTLFTRVLRSFVRDAQSSSGLTLSQITVLQELVAKNGQTLTQLRKRVNVSHSSVSGILDRLARRGLVVRRPGDTDRRYVQVYSTGRVIVFVHHKMLQQYAPLTRALANLPIEDKATITAALTILSDTLRDIDL